MAADLASAVTGDLRSGLEALRDHLALEMVDGVRCKECHGTVSSPTAPLAKQLADVLKALSSLPVAKGSVSDDLKAKRAARQAGVAKRAARSEQRRSRGDRASS